MNLREYFENREGLGVLATADAEGAVDAALYARPHVLDDGLLAFIMRDRLSHANLQSNPSAVYLFVEAGEGYTGKRLYLRRIREEKDTTTIDQLRRRGKHRPDSGEHVYLVVFEVTDERPLVGNGTA